MLWSAGQGLGKDGMGRSAPLPVLLLPSRRGLGGAEGQLPGGGGVKKRRRGGEKARRSKQRATQRAAKNAAADAQNALEMAEDAQGMFAFINKSLGDTSVAAMRLRGLQDQARSQGQGRFRDEPIGTSAPTTMLQVRKSAQGTHQAAAVSSSAAHGDSRKGLLQQQESLNAAQVQVQKLQQMMARNSGNKTLAPQIQAKLQEAQGQVISLEAHHARMRKTLSDKDAHKRWAKF